jgi:tetratricopeptide (TPR) repeat protein
MTLRKLQRTGAPVLVGLLLALFFVLPAPAFSSPGIRPSTIEALEAAVVRARADVSADPADSAARARLGALLTTDGRHDEAEAVLRGAPTGTAADPALDLALARLYRLEYRFEEGQAALARAAALEPQAEEVRTLGGAYALDRMDFDAATASFEAALEASPGSAAALCGLAEVAYGLNRYSEAEGYIKRCLAADPGFGRAYLIQSLIHRIRQENDQWKAAGRKAAEVSPLDDEVRANLSNILMRGEHKLDEGYAQALLALRLNPLCYSAHNYIGNGWTSKTYGPETFEGSPETAARIQALLKAGSEALISRTLDEADKDYDEVLRIAPATVRALIGKGTAGYHRRRFRESLAWFRKALEVDPDYGLAHYGAAQSLLRLKDAVNVKLAGIEKRFAERDAPEPPFLRDVFVNYGRLDPDLQRIIRISVRPWRSFLRLAKEKAATFYITPFHFRQSEAPNMAGIKGERTFDGRLWDDVKGLGGHNALSGEDWERDVRNLRFNVVAHEFTHQVHGLFPKELRDEVKALFEKAKAGRKTLDFYADFNEFEYLAVGVEAYVSEEKLADQKVAYGHTRKELLDKDPDLYRLIERFDRKD